jgi:ribonuclease Z
MLDICLLGTGGMMPLPYRYLTSMMARCEGSNLLIDCGEGTQVAIKKKAWSPKPVDVILFTHFHADHISGLPGFLLTMGNAERKEPVLLVGPKGLIRVVNALRTIAPELPYELKFHELTQDKESLKVGPYRIEAFKVNHNVVCYGYSINIDRKGKFDAARAKELNIPLKFWSKLQNGETMTDGEKTYTPDMVMGEERKGIKVTYCTDTRPVKTISDMAKGSDLFICEGMYGEEEKISNAKEYKHMTMYEAAGLAKAADVKAMWLTHYSPSVNRPEEYIDKIREIFPRTKAATDGQSIELGFEDE